jgi:predicted acyl esterase
MKTIGIGRTRALLAAITLYAGALGTACAAGNASAIASGQPQTPWPGGTWTPEAASYGTAQDLQLGVTMSDGVVLEVDVSYPTNPATGARAAGPFPVLLTQTPYLSTSPTAGDYFVQRGYIYVTAFIRGTTTSGGNFMFFSARDAEDGAELVKWAATKLQNSSGIVGLSGGSYAGLNQIYTVAALGAASPVKAMAASCMGAEFYRETYFAGGIPTQTIQFPNYFRALMGGTTTAAYGAALYADVIAGGEKAYDGAFWQERTPGHYVQKVVDADVPTLIWSSNADIYARSSLELYAYMQNAYAKRFTYGPMQKNTPVTGRYQIIISQGGHCANEDQAIQLEWFDTWLKGTKTGMERTGRLIHVHELISNQWFNTSHYPVAPTYTKYYLNLYGQLSTASDRDTGQDTIAWVQPSGAYSTAQYDSPAFPTGGTLAGPISASVFASSTTANLELIASVQLIAADGTVTPLVSGAVLSSLSKNDPDRSWFDNDGTPVRPYGKYDYNTYVPAGAIERYDFAIEPIFAHIPLGSKLRLIFTTQTPMAQCTPILGTDPCFPTTPQTATGTFTIYHHSHKGPSSDQHPPGGSSSDRHRPEGSSLNLPLLKSDCWLSTDNPTDPLAPDWNVDPVVHGADAPCQE